MKKHLIIALIIFLVVVVLSLASNFIHWDETPLEQTIFALPLGIGLLLELPFLTIISPLAQTDATFIYFKQLAAFIPFIAGLFYAGLYYLIIFVSKKLLK
ncbi:MAG: hypothetical protein V1664_02495 [Candidatus Uhrbacteria bacterium]